MLKRKRRNLDEIIADLEAELAELKEKAKERDKFSPDTIREERERLKLSAADYGRLVGQLRQFDYDRALTVDIVEQDDVEHEAEMRKIRLLLESLL